MKQSLNEQFLRMQKLAGIITEGDYRENTDEVVGPWSRNYNDGDDIVNYNTDGSNEEVPDMFKVDYQGDKIVMDDDTKDAILDNEELQQFITPKSFVRNKIGQTVLWIDWMEPEQFDKLATFLGIKY